MNELYTFIISLKQKGIHIDETNGNLKVFGKVANLTDEDKTKIREYKSDLIDFCLQRQVSDGDNSAFIPVIEEAEDYEVSSSQYRLWILCQLEEASISYNMPEHLMLHETIDFEKLEEAIKQTINRHEVLRTVFKVNDLGKLRQRVIAFNDFDFSVKTIDYTKDSDGETKAIQYISGNSFQPFDLEKGPLVRVSIIKLANSKTILYTNTHHIIGDGWSNNVLMSDVLAFYKAFAENEPVALPKLKLQYKDYSAWQQVKISGQKYEQAKKYFAEYLAGDLPLLNVPSSYARPVVKTHKGKKLGFSIKPEIADKLKNYHLSKGGSLFMALLSSMKVLLHRYTGQKDIIVGSPVSGRDHEDLENQIGFYVNSIVLRNNISGSDSFNEVYEKVKKTTLKAYQFQDYPFDHLVEDLSLKRDVSRSAIFDIMITLQSSSQETMLDAAYKNDDVHDLGDCISRFDLEIDFEEKEGYIWMTVLFNADIYSDADIENLMRHYSNLLEGLLEKSETPIGEAKYTTVEEENKLLQFNKTEVATDGNETYVDRFYEQVQNSPNAIAIQDKDRNITYKELDQRSNQLAHFLMSCEHSGKENILGIITDRSYELILSIIAAFKAGYSYVAIDANYPEERIKPIISDAEIHVVCTSKNHVGLVSKLQIECTNLTHFVCLDSEDVYAEYENKDHEYKELWNYVGETSKDDVEGGGWISSYTGEPFSTLEMDEYGESFYNSIKPYLHKEARVLEIGCASGITLKKVAPHVKEFVGVDISESTIRKQKKKLASIENVSLACLSASEIDMLDKGTFDVVIINSVVQDFESPNYLRNVIDKISEILNPSGVIAIGDVMDAALKDDLLKSLLTFKRNNLANDYVTKTDFSSELFLSKAFFKDLVAENNHFTSVVFEEKDFTVSNELTDYRFDAILVAGTATETNISKQKFQYDARVLNVQSEEAPQKTISPNDTAYIIYTSGSTGVPKGVLLHHKGLLNHLDSMIEELNLTQNSKIIQNASVTFDISVWQLLNALLIGGTTLIYGSELVNEPTRFIEKLRDDKASILQVVPSYLSILLDEANQGDFDGLEFLLVTGEAVSQDILIRWFDAYPNIKVVNAYGPAEASDDVTLHIMSKAPESYNVPIGKPIRNMKVHILDDFNQKCPIGVIGEICVSGIGVGDGYLNNSALTAEKFVSDPFDASQKMYKTGDLGKWSWDGELFFLGRKDFQVKVRGHRIELGEIESKVNLFVEKAIILEEEGDLVGFIKNSNKVNVQELELALNNYLPDYMIPRKWKQLEVFPLSSNGKIDKKKLFWVNEEITNYVAPKNEREEKIQLIWQRVLNLESISMHNDFFQLGGHSIKAMRLISEYHKTFDIKLQLKDIFANTTASAHSALLEIETTEKYNAITLAPQLENYPLSDGQKRLWVISQFKNMSQAYNMPAHVYLDGAHDVAMLQEAIGKVVARHEVLRTIFKNDVDGEVKQWIIPTDKFSWEIAFEDITAMESSDDYALEYVRKDSFIPFDFVNGPLFRGKIFKHSDTKFSLYFNIHHIIGDGWSDATLFRDILAFYKAISNKQKVALVPLKLNYKDYAYWQLNQIKEGVWDAHKDFWLETFKGEIPQLELPIQKTRPLIKTTNGKCLRMIIPANTIENLVEFSREKSSSLFIGLLSVWQVLFHKYSGQEEVILGSPIAGREHPDLENQIGFYVNTLALKSTLNEQDTFLDFFNRNTAHVLECYAHQMYPFDGLIELLNIKKSPNRNALFDVLITLQNTVESNADAELANIGQIQDLGFKMVKLDIEVNFEEQGGCVILDLVYNTDVYSDFAMREMLHGYLKTLEKVVSEPKTEVSKIAVVSSEWKRNCLENKGLQQQLPAEKTAIDLFYENVSKYPDNIAVVFGDKNVSYKELDIISNKMSHCLQATYNIKETDVVAVLLEKSDCSIVTILAILKLKAIYVPLDTTNPERRLTSIVNEVNAKLVVVDTENMQKLKDTACAKFNIHTNFEIENYPETRVSVATDSKAVAYILYTSGSTGNPKGVKIQHEGILNSALDYVNEFNITPDDKYSLFFSTAFDGSILDIFTSLVGGASLVIFDKNSLADPSTFVAQINRHKVSILLIVPAYLNAITQYSMPTVRTIITAGEMAITKDAMLYAKSKNYYNAYGPTECSVVSSYYKVDPKKEYTSIPMGSASTNKQLLILDKDMNIMPPYGVGEICISGIGLSTGYLNDELKTNEKFVNHPFEVGSILYKSGDTGYLDEENIFHFVGRKDDQVKIRGYRIEIGEVESALLQIPAISNVAVVVKGNNSDEKNLFAYYTTTKNLDVAAIQSEIYQILPPYMIPQKIIQLDKIPMTLTGKINRKELMSYTDELTNSERILVPPTNELEKQLVEIIAAELNLEASIIGVEDNFFDIGANSIKIIKILNTINMKFKTELETVTLFKFPNIKELAQNINSTTEKTIQEETDLNADDVSDMMDDMINLMNI
ncbi:non-ribosomal peptide synthetase [uncultured Kordia sp.]|uniref:non-ribosomal peptide synthetase n=1 Tax=uncultured Kordia sp. TaxID=507699 RepID=UPI00261EF2BB|nr:non-ribosomal peptide synthetase [uncultured Kordia sp.]